MKIVLDANIFISGLLWHKKPGKIVDRAFDGQDTLFVSDEIIAEIDRVFRKRKFKQTEEQIKEKIQRIKRAGAKITVSERITVGGCRDKTDNVYLECAAAANADYIVSGDIHLRELKEYRGIGIVNAAEYLEIVGGLSIRADGKN